MWRALLELCADVFGATKRTRRWPAAAAFAAAFGLSTLLLVRWGLEGLALVAVLGATAVVPAWHVLRARAQLWRTALLPLDHPGQRPAAIGGVLVPPTAIALQRLAHGVDTGRRRAPADTQPRVLVRDADRARLLPPELELLDAACAPHAPDDGDANRDASVARRVVRSAWTDPPRLAAIERIWSRAAVDRDAAQALGRLHALVRVRLDGVAAQPMPSGDALRLADEARAIGDEELAADLETQLGRDGAYR